jgi:DNA modification methylase
MHRRNFLGIELIQNYFDDAKVRINNALSEMGQADKILSPTASIPRLFA